MFAAAHAAAAAADEAAEAAEEAADAVDGDALEGEEEETAPDDADAEIDVE